MRDDEDHHPTDSRSTTHRHEDNAVAEATVHGTSDNHRSDPGDTDACGHDGKLDRHRAVNRRLQRRRWQRRNRNQMVFVDREQCCRRRHLQHPGLCSELCKWDGDPSTHHHHAVRSAGRTFHRDHRDTERPDPKCVVPVHIMAAWRVVIRGFPVPGPLAHHVRKWSSEIPGVDRGGCGPNRTPYRPKSSTQLR